MPSWIAARRLAAGKTQSLPEDRFGILVNNENF